MLSPEDQISTLALLAKVDDDVAKEEYDLILFIAEQLGLTKEKAEELFKSPNPIPDFKSVPKDEKFMYLFNVIKVMKVDGRVHPKEVRFCEKLAIKLGYKPGVIADLSQYVYADPSINSDKELLWSIAESNTLSKSDSEN